MDSLTKTNIWKKVSKQAEKVKNEVRQKKTKKDRKNPEQPTSFQTEDEGIYEDLPCIETINNSRHEETEYSFAAAETEDPANWPTPYRTSTWGSTQIEVTRLDLPRTVALKNEIQDFHRKAASLGRDVPGFSGVQAASKTTARSWQDMTSLQRTQQQQRHETVPYSEKQEVDNVLYQPFGGSLSSSVTSDDGFQSGGMHFDEAEAYYSSAAPPSKSWQLPSRNNVPNRKAVNYNSPSPLSCPSSPLYRNNRSTSNPPYAHSSSLTLPCGDRGNEQYTSIPAAHLDDEPIFGTIEKSHVAMVRSGNMMRYEENHRDDSVYSETPNVYDFE